MKVLRPSLNIGQNALMLPLFCALIILSTSISALGKVPETSSVIRIIVNNWTSQIVLSKVLGTVYEQHGYQVEFVELATKNQWSHLHRGLVHIQAEVWEGTMAADFERVLKFGQIVDAGNHSAKTREEWWYPVYVEQVCPGLPDWRALRNCSHLFAEDGSDGRGRYVAGPWEKPERARIKALDLNFNVDAVEKSDDLWAELKKARNEKKPIVLFNWSPNWVEDRYHGKFVEFPEYDALCETDPSWGINTERTYDCGNPKNGWLKKVAWVGLEPTWPCAAAILREMDFTNAMISELAALVDADGLSHDQAAEKWIHHNKNIWAKWGGPVCSD